MLEAIDELDNTLVIITMDHGQTAKGTLYQAGRSKGGDDG